MRVFKPKYKDRKGREREGKKWYLEFTDASGVARRLAGFTDRGTTAALGRGVQRLVDRGEIHEPLDPELARWVEKLSPGVRQRLAAVGLLDSKRLAAMRPLSGHLEDFRESLLPGRAPRHVEQVVSKLKLIFEECRFNYFQDIRAEEVDRFLRRLREGKVSLKVEKDEKKTAKKAVGVQTSNHYLGALRHFCRWMVAHGRAAESPLNVLRALNAAPHRRKVRRALSEAELRGLIEAATRGPLRACMSGPERALVYRLAAETGLRAGELASLTRASFELKGQPPTVTVEAAYSKRRRRDVLPLRQDTAMELAHFLADRLPGARAFNFPWQTAVRKAFRADLEDSGVKDLDDPLGPLDFHSLRHTFLTNLARAGVHPKTAQALARHSTISLTLDRYTHVALGDEVRAIEALPRLGASDRSLKATGTHGGKQRSSEAAGEADSAAASCRSVPVDAASRGEEAGRGYARRDSNPRLSDPKSDALSS